MSLLDRLAIFAVPAIAGALTATVLLGPGAERPALGARVQARVAVAADRCALRVQTLAHERGRLSPRSVPSIEIELRQDGRALGRWQGATDASGLAEAGVDLGEPVRGPLEVSVSSGDEELARGVMEPAESLTVSPPAPLAELDGPPSLRVSLPRRALVAELPEELVAVATFGGSDPDPDLRVEASGADALVHAEPRTCSEQRCSRSWTLSLTPRSPIVELSLELRRQEQQPVRWEGQLPVLTGRIWLDPKALARGELRLQAASAHDVAYLSLVSERGRFWGAIVPLQVDAQGRSAAHVPLPSLPAGPVTALVSSDASEGEASTVAWPLRPALGQVEGGGMVVVGDGMPAAIAAEERRQKRARWPAFGLITSAGLFELLYLWQRQRRSRHALRAHLERSADGDGRGRDLMLAREPLIWLVLLAGGLLLAFFILAAVAAWA